MRCIEKTKTMLRLKEMLKNRKLSAKELSDLCNISENSISKIITGKTSPSLDTLERIALALSVPVSELFAEPSTDTVHCPKCGARLTLREKTDLS